MLKLGRKLGVAHPRVRGREAQKLVLQKGAETGVERMHHVKEFTFYLIYYWEV